MFTRSTRQVFYIIALAAVIVIPRAILIQRAHSESADDEFHLLRGLEFLHRDHGLVHRELNDPPLGEALGAIPLWVMGGTTHGKSEGTAIYDQANYSPETALMMVAVWKAIVFLPLVAVVFIWCRKLYGVSSGVLAVILLVIEPTIAGHLHLASLDVLGTTGIVIACYLGWRYFEKPTAGRLVMAACACAAALLIKHTAVLVPAVLCGYGGLRALRRAEGNEPDSAWRPSSRVVVALLNGAFITLFAIWVLLAFDVSPIRHAAGASAKGMTERAVPAGLYIKSIQDAAQHVSEPNMAYLSGEAKKGGWWYYFPVVATYKIPVGIGFLIAMGLLSYFNRRLAWQEWSLILPLAGYVLFLMLQSINIGWRHFLPAYVLLLMLSSRCLAPGVTGRIAPWIIVVLVGFNAVLRWHPDYSAYIAWPRKDAYLAISDSNLDWGQGLKQVRGWVDENREFIGGRAVYLRAFTVTKRGVQYYLGDRVHTLNPGDSPPRSGILILSPVCLSGISESNDEYAFLRNTPPRNLIGHTLRVYDLDHLER